MLVRPVLYTGAHRRPMDEAAVEKLKAVVSLSVAVAFVAAACWIAMLVRPSGVVAARPGSPAVAEIAAPKAAAPDHKRPEPAKSNQAKSKPPKPRPPAIKLMEVGVAEMNVRPMASAVGNTPVGQLHFGDQVKVLATVTGRDPNGTVNGTWYQLDNNTYVWAGYIFELGKAPRCVRPISAEASRISSWYEGRVLDGVYEFHRGIDFAAAGGTPIVAVQGGEVIASGKTDTGFGAWVRVQDEQGRIWTYGHVDRQSVVPAHVQVRTGQRIANVGYGQVGQSTGPHLHLGIDTTGNYSWIDPEPVLAGCGVRLR